jgi:hypothetical protein
MKEGIRREKMGIKRKGKGRGWREGEEEKKRGSWWEFPFLR